MVDSVTDAPIAEAVVVARWELEGGLAHTSHIGELEILETRTDANGRFRFPGWGPKRHYGIGRLLCNDPQIIVFKPGYLPKFVSNPWEGPLDTRTDCLGEDFSHRKSMWNGKTIRVISTRGNAEAYAKALHALSQFVENLHQFANSDSNECSWAKTPQLLRALHIAGGDFEAQGLKTPGHELGERFFQLESIPPNPACANLTAAINGSAP